MIARLDFDFIKGIREKRIILRLFLISFDEIVPSTIPLICCKPIFLLLYCFYYHFFYSSEITET